MAKEAHVTHPPRPTLPQRNPDEHCTCHRKGRNVHEQVYHDSACGYVRIHMEDHRKWQTMSNAWEEAAQNAIRHGVLSPVALDLIEHRHGHGYGEISRSVMYLVTLLRKQIEETEE
jgi:ribosomal protein L37E